MSEDWMLWRPRMPIWASIDPIRRHWLYWVVTVDFLYGAINMFGKNQGPPAILLRSILPLPFWYGLLVLASGLITFGWNVRGGMVGILGWGSLAVANILTIFHGTALSYGGSVPLIGWAGVHILITYDVSSGLDEERERTQRKH